MPIGLLMPVESISIRLRIGGTHRFASPGSRTVLSSSSMILSIVMPGRHCSCGLSWMVVSTISSGAESVAVSAFPVLPNTRATSGTLIISLSVFCSILAASAAEIPGSVDGIYNKSPSLICGKNSPPTLLSGQRTVSTESAATSSVVFGQCSTFSNSG